MSTWWSRQRGMLISCLIGSTILNRFGWVLVGAVSTALMAVTVVSVTQPWWAIDFFTGCDDRHFSVFLQYGFCEVSKPQGVTRFDCVAWYERSKWDRIDEQSGVDTHRATNAIYPWIRIMSFVALFLNVVQVALCGLQWYKQYRTMAIQRTVLLLTWTWLLIISATQSMGGQTTVTRLSTWEFTNTCSDGLSYAAAGYVAVNVAAYFIVGSLIAIINFPTKFW